MTQLKDRAICANVDGTQIFTRKEMSEMNDIFQSGLPAR